MPLSLPPLPPPAGSSVGPADLPVGDLISEVCAAHRAGGRWGGDGRGGIVWPRASSPDALPSRGRECQAESSALLSGGMTVTGVRSCPISIQMQTVGTVKLCSDSELPVFKTFTGTLEGELQQKQQNLPPAEPAAETAAGYINKRLLQVTRLPPLSALSPLSDEVTALSLLPVSTQQSRFLSSLQSPEPLPSLPPVIRAASFPPSTDQSGFPTSSHQNGFPLQSSERLPCLPPVDQSGFLHPLQSSERLPRTPSSHQGGFFPSLHSLGSLPPVIRATSFPTSTRTAS